MTSSIDGTPDRPDPDGSGTVKMPSPTAWPIVLALGITLLGAGLVTSLALSVVGALLFVLALGGWIGQLLPGRGHQHEPMVEPARRPRPASARQGMVDRLEAGVPGYRFQLPMKVHPISSGVRGGIVGGLVMPIPAIAYGILSGHGPWFPINLLAGIVIPGISGETMAQLEQFSPVALVVATVIHAALSLVFGLMFGVVSPTSPPIPGGPVVAGGVLMPLLWSGLCYGLLGIVNPVLGLYINWPWFVASQAVYGLAMSIVVVNSEKVPAPPVSSGPGLSGSFPAPGPDGGPA